MRITSGLCSLEIVCMHLSQLPSLPCPLQSPLFSQHMTKTPGPTGTQSLQLAPVLLNVCLCFFRFTPLGMEGESPYSRPEWTLSPLPLALPFPSFRTLVCQGFPFVCTFRPAPLLSWTLRMCSNFSHCELLLFIVCSCTSDWVNLLFFKSIFLQELCFLSMFTVSILPFTDCPPTNFLLLPPRLTRTTLLF